MIIWRLLRRIICRVVLGLWISMGMDHSLLFKGIFRRPRFKSQKFNREGWGLKLRWIWEERTRKKISSLQFGHVLWQSRVIKTSICSKWQWMYLTPTARNRNLTNSTGTVWYKRLSSRETTRRRREGWKRRESRGEYTRPRGWRRWSSILTILMGSWSILEIKRRTIRFKLLKWSKCWCMQATTHRRAEK